MKSVIVVCAGCERKFKAVPMVPKHCSRTCFHTAKQRRNRQKKKTGK